MFLKFVDRFDELHFLNHRFKSSVFEFFVIYGRRRVGKTELIKNFLRNKPHVYLLCDKSGTRRNAYRLKKKVAEFLNEPVIATDDLEEIFSHLITKLGKETKKKRLIIAFDEFSYLIEKDDAVASIFQVVCDEVLKTSNVFLILCGSSVSMMEEGVLAKKSPLYGRKTAHIKLLPVAFNYFKHFFPLNSLEKNIEFYAVLDGVPFYLEKFSDKKTTFENISEQILSKEGKLYEEIDFLLREELREPAVYKTILAAIASGKTKTSDIANKSNIKVQDMDKYLKVLIRLGIIKKEIPVTETKSKKSIYVIDDNFFSFCFSFSEPFKSDIEIGEIKNVEAKLKQDFSSFVGRRFEKLILGEIIRKTDIFPMQKIGKWWGHYRDKETNERKSIEIDITALNKETKQILFAECKWKNRVNALKIVKELAEKSEYVQWNNERRKEYYAVFAKTFTKKIKEFEGKPVKCIDLKDLQKMLKKKTR